LVRRAGRAIAPLPSLSFFIVCMVLTLAVPHLMTPDTAPGPGSLASPAVQAYVPGSGLAGRGSARGSGPAVAPRTTEVAAAVPGGTATAATAGPGTAPGPVVQLIATATRPRPVRPAPVPVTPAAAAVTAAAITTPVPTVTPSPVVSPAASPPGTTSPAGPAAKTNSGAKAVKPSKADRIGPSLKGHKRVDAGAKPTAAKEEKTARPARKAVSPRRMDGA
jgi:hypothetical protein